LQENVDRFNNALYKEKEMADFRRSIIVLAALALLLGTASTVSAQGGFSCSTNAASPTLIRQEGITELTGDLVLNCTGGAQTALNAIVPQINIQIFLNTSVTSRLLVSTVGGASEALLLVDDPPEGSQNVCTADASPCPMHGLGASTADSYLDVGGATAGNKNVFQGTWSVNQPSSITFLGVPIDPPGTTFGAPSPNVKPRTFRITNVRANASQFAVAGSGGSPTQIFESVSVSNPTAMPINNPQQIVAFIARGLVSGAASSVSFKQCSSVNATGSTLGLLVGAPNGIGNAGVVKATEGFASAFKVRNISVFPAIGGPNFPTATPSPQDIPGVIYSDTESGFYNPVHFPANVVPAGLADFGTRIKVEFQNVPTGAHVYVPLTLFPGAAGVVNGTGTAGSSPLAGGSLILNLVTSEAGAYTAAAASAFGATLAEVTLTAGAGEAVYEVVAANQSVVEEADIPITVAYVANPGTNSPAIGPVATAGVSCAPTTTPPDTLAELAAVPVPRFVDTGLQVARFSINACATHLLFPFVANTAGYDTGIAIANTSMDPYMTSTQTGLCTITPFGTPTSTAFKTPAAVAAGTLYTNLVSIMFPGFEGYLIADCAFQYAHGFAFLLGNGTSPNAVAQGYIALIIPDPPRAATPFPLAGASSGEQLGQ
jgi:hypothetical protein